MLGAFLGECIAVNFGGTWKWSEEFKTYGIFLHSGQDEIVVYPVTKVWKQFENGIEGGDGIFGFYQTIEAMTNADFGSTTRLSTTEQTIKHPSSDNVRSKLPLVHSRYLALASIVGGTFVCVFIIALLDLRLQSPRHISIFLAVFFFISLLLWFLLRRK